MDLKKEVVQRNIKQEAESEPYSADSFTPLPQVKHEDYPSTEPDQIESALELLNGHPAEDHHSVDCKALPTCRFCAQPIRSTQVHLYKNNLQQKVNYLPISIVAGDGLPEYICQNCEVSLNSFYNFVCQVVNADKTIRAKVKPDVKANDVTSTIKEIFGADPSELEQATTKQQPELKQTTKRPHQDDEDSQLQKVTDDQPRKLQKIEDSFKSSFKCSHCGQVFSSYFALVHHTKDLHGNLQYPCPEPDCLKVFSNGKALRQHIMDNHNVPVICFKCGKIFTHQEALQKHQDNFHPFKVCAKCGMVFRTLPTYKTHMLMHEDVGESQCVFCYKSFISRQKLHRHTRQTHSGNFTLLVGDNNK